MITQGRICKVSIEGSKSIYVGDAARAAIREDARAAFDQRIRAAVELWETTDLEDLDAVKQVQFEVLCAADCINALLFLAPVPDDDDA